MSGGGDFPSREDPEIGPAGLQALLEGRSRVPFQLIDCREEDEHALCRIEGSRLVPLATLPADEALHRDTPVIVYCHHGVRSLQAIRYLRSRGWSQAWSLAGGIDAWSREVDPSVPRY